MKIINNINFNGKQLKNAVVDKLGNAPSSPIEGQIYFNDGSVNAGDIGFYIRQGSTWKKLTDQSMTNEQIFAAVLASDGTGSLLDADKLDGQEGTYYMAASTKLNAIPAPDGSVSLNSQKITNLGTPTANSTDAATTAYVDTKVSAFSQGLDPKESVKAVAVTNVSISGEQTIDTVELVAGDRVLLTLQDTASQNRIYIVSAGSWTVAPDSDGANLTKGAHTYSEKDGRGYVYLGNNSWTRFDERTTVSGGTGISVSTTGTTSTVSINPNVVARQYVADVTVTNSAGENITVTHGLGTEAPIVQVRENSTSYQVLVDNLIVDGNNIRLDFGDTATGSYRVTVIGASWSSV